MCTSCAKRRQVDQETRLLLAVHDTGVPRVSLLVGVGYRVRFSGIQDEIAPTLVIPVAITDGLTLTGSLTGGIAVGTDALGALAKDALTPGVTLSFAPSRRLDVFAAYHRTLYGHNVVDAHIVTAGAGFSL